MKRVSYVIYKKTAGGGIGESWDYDGDYNRGFRTRAAARRVFKRKYANPGGERAQDFRIVKVTEETVKP